MTRDVTVNSYAQLSNAISALEGCVANCYFLIKDNVQWSRKMKMIWGGCIIERHSDQ